MPPKRTPRRSRTPEAAAGPSRQALPAAAPPPPRRLRRRSETPPIAGPSRPRPRGVKPKPGKTGDLLQPPTKVIGPSTSAVRIDDHGDIDDLTINQDTGVRTRKRTRTQADLPDQPLTGTLGDYLPHATDEWSLLHAIATGAAAAHGSNKRPRPSIEPDTTGTKNPPTPPPEGEEEEESREQRYQYHQQHLDPQVEMATQPTPHAARPTDPADLARWKRAWLAGFRREDVATAANGEAARPGPGPGPGPAGRDRMALARARDRARAKAAEEERAILAEDEVRPGPVRPPGRMPRVTGPPEPGLVGVEEEAEAAAAAVGSGKSVRQVVVVVDEDERDRAVGRLRRVGWEWSEDVVLDDGARQPPLGVRLEQVLNFLREEDRDRCLGWEEKMAEVEGFLGWVGSRWDMRLGVDGGREAVSKEVKNMFLDAQRKVRVHRLFEGWHYETARPALQAPEDAVEIVSSRQPGWATRRDAAAHFRFAPGKEPPALEPRKMLVAKPQRTNTLFPRGSREGKAFRRELARAADRFWEGQEVDPEKNLYLIEDAAYRGYRTWKEGQYNLTVDGKGKLPDPEEVKRVNQLNEVDEEGRVPEATARQRDREQGLDFGPRPKPAWMTDEEYAELLNEVEGTASQKEKARDYLDPEIYDLSDREDEDTRMTDVGGPVSPKASGTDNRHRLFVNLKRKAEIRGTRRAALQEALRYFTNIPNISAQTQWTTVVPPIEQRYIEAIKRDLDRNHQYSLPSIDWETAPIDKDRTETMPYTIQWRLHRKRLQAWSETALEQVTTENAADGRWVAVPKSITCGGPFVWRMVDAQTQKAQDLLKKCEILLRAIKQCADKDDSKLLSQVYSLAQGVLQRDDLPVTLPDSVVLRDDERNEGAEGAESIKLLTSDEVQWLTFLTGRAVNGKMLEPLPESKLALYGLFTRRLDKIMNDRSPCALFRTKTPSRTIEELLEVMNASCDGPISKTPFDPFQAKLFLERAQEQGLCTYRPDLLVYGRVSRSRRTIYPWDHIVFTDRDTPTRQSSSSSALSPAPRTQDATTRREIAQIFRNLGFRLGCTIRDLRHHQAKPVSRTRLHDTLDKYYAVLARLVNAAEHGEGRSTSLVSVIAQANPADLDDSALFYPAQYRRDGLDYLADTGAPKHASTEESALGLIRRRIIEEARDNLPFVGRGRKVPNPRNSSDDDDEGVAMGYSWDHNWDWASAAVRGRTRQYFSLDRWPVNFQTAETRRRIQSDADVDGRYVRDVFAEDPVPPEYIRPKLRRYGEDDDEDGVVFRPGTPVYWEGDTVRQRRYVRRLFEERVGEALGIDPHPPRPPPTWTQRLAGMVMPWKRREPREATPDSPAWDAHLPKVDPELIPKSQDPWDPKVEARIRASAGLPADGRVLGDVDVDMPEV